MVQKKKFNFQHSFLFVGVIVLCFINCSTQNSKNGNLDERQVVVGSNNKTDIPYVEEDSSDTDIGKMICLSSLVDVTVGKDTTWIGQVDHNPNKNSIDTLWSMSLNNVYKSERLDRLLGIDVGFYMNYEYDYGYLGEETDFDILNKINTSTNKAYAILVEEDSSTDCKKVLDVLCYGRAYFVTCAFEVPGSGPYVNYVATGVYLNKDGSIYDKQNKIDVFYEGSHEYRINKIYGITSKGEFVQIEDKKGIIINPSLKQYYFNDTIVFSMPY